MGSKIRHKDQLTDLEWGDSGHTGTPNKLAGFDSSGNPIYVDAASWNNAVQVLSGTTPTWDAVSGINATLTLSGDTTITLSNLVAGMSGNLTITNPSTVYTLTVAGYTNKISTSVYSAANVMLTSGGSKIDMYSWYYDGTYLVWNGSQDYK